MDQQLTEAVIVPLVIGLVEAFKKAGLPGHLAPLLAITFGLLASFGLYYGQSHPSVMPMVLTGVGIGLSASGLYSSSTTIYQKIRPSTK